MQFEEIYKRVEENRQNRLDGNYNSIPWSFDRLTDEYNYPGWVKGKMYLVTASSGIAKSKFTKWLTIVSTYMKWKEKPFKTKIFWFALEESKEKLYLEAISIAIIERL
jgi:replicative DNA helicase